AFGIDDDPESLRETGASLVNHLLHRVVTGLTINRDRRRERESPTEKRNGKELLLGHERKRREIQIERQRFERRAVLRHHDMRRRRNVFAADDAPADPAYPTRGKEVDAAPVARDQIARYSRQPAEQQEHGGVYRRYNGLEQQEQQRAQVRDHEKPSLAGEQRGHRESKVG